MSPYLVGLIPTVERRNSYRLYVWDDERARVEVYDAWQSNFPDGPPTGKGVPCYVGRERRKQAAVEVLR